MQGYSDLVADGDIDTKDGVLVKRLRTPTKEIWGEGDSSAALLYKIVFRP